MARVLEVDGAGVMAPAHDSLLRFVFATSDPSRMADQMQEVLQDGPCVAAAASGEIVNVGDLTHEGDWPLFQARAVDAGLHAVTAIPLRARDTTWGVLDLYRERAERLDDAEPGGRRPAGEPGDLLPGGDRRPRHRPHRAGGARPPRHARPADRAAGALGVPRAA
ncbi:hypothetical protein GCM10025868_31700 [Angustibacter aerolatus]|uniref:GAF domain-containing protein n=1 Tax=Angustibacter aerolatus TaxID=1162965 RepID=A0ABQ6JKY9_9ACTN|nr:hypothetical protein GCM10025868_31700 [Angustibacter aerolatus]